MRFTAFCVCAIFYLHVCTDAVTVGFNSTEKVQDTSFENDSDMENYSEEQNLTGERHDTVANTSLLLKMATPCRTPNNDEGLCVGIRECSILYNQLDNKMAKRFLQDSMCGPENELASNPKVCCGRYNNYKKANPLKPNGNRKKSGKVRTQKCGRQKRITRSRILGGNTAALGEFPWMARLIRKKNNFKSFGCGGFLIRNTFVVTAAHCVSNNSVTGPLYEVVFGEHDTTTVIDCSAGRKECALPLQKRRVAVVIVHPQYDPKAKGYYNDIALIRLKSRVQITEYVRPICLLSDSNASPYKYTVSGWGSTEKNSLSTVKMKVDLLSVEKSSCQSIWSIFNIHVKDTQRCAGGDGKTDTCRGDSGGPLMMTLNGSVWFAAGIVSYGLGCGIEKWPGIYTNIPSYLPWIKEQILIHKKRRV